MKISHITYKHVGVHVQATVHPAHGNGRPVVLLMDSWDLVRFIEIARDFRARMQVRADRIARALA